MPNSLYSLRPLLWPFWAWRVRLPGGSIVRGIALGKAAARSAACVQRARLSTRRKLSRMPQTLP